MPRKLLACWNFTLLLLTPDEYDRCTTNPVEDITKREIAWDKAALGNSLPILDGNEGIVCRAPSEGTVDLLGSTGACCKFTEASEGRLTCEHVANFPGITHQESFFAFPASYIQEQSLYVGIVNGPTITLHRHQEKAWEFVKSHSISSLVAW